LAGAITYTYATLVSSLQDYVEDDGAEYVAELPNIINRAELRCVRDLDLNVFNTRTSGNLTASTGVQPKPTDSLIVDSVFLTASRTWLQRRSLDFVTAYDNGTEAEPKYFASDDAEDTDVRMAPVPDTTYAVIWNTYARPDKLVSSTNETNWLTDKVGDLLFRACIVESMLYLQMHEAIGPEEGAYTTILQQAVKEFEQFSRRDQKDLQAAARVSKP